MNAYDEDVRKRKIVHVKRYCVRIKPSDMDISQVTHHPYMR